MRKKINRKGKQSICFFGLFVRYFFASTQKDGCDGGSVFVFLIIVLGALFLPLLYVELFIAPFHY